MTTDTETGSPQGTQKETRGFQTEVTQLLDLMIHSLYSSKEIFLRELISNASDAADKLRFEALSDEGLYEGSGDLEVEIESDEAARNVTVRDNGVGMSYDEVVEHLGTIAKSGTRQFFEKLTGDAARDAELIGQFGVGFYSSFIVADRVTVTTRRAGLPAADGVRWSSDGKGEYTIERLEGLRRGTEVVLHLREGEEDLAQSHRLRAIVSRYSDHISLPIKMTKEGEDETGMEIVNKATALWTRNKREIGADEYTEFYKHVSHDFSDPLAHVHSRVEGNLEYTSLLYIPSRAPFDLWDRSQRHGVKLYVRRVFIMDDAEQLMPAYLRFVRGVIDSADLPLNISREILQQNKQIDSIRNGSTKKVLDLLGSLADSEPEKFATFWEQFGKVLKEGIIDDHKNRDTVARLLRFASTRGDGEKPGVSLPDYVSRMAEGQDKIYYVTADNYLTARNSPHLEIFEARGIEVLLLTDEIDEWVVNHLNEFDGKALQSVSHGELDLGDVKASDAAGEAAEIRVEADADHAPLVEKLKRALGERVKDVRTTTRLTSSPACLVADASDMGGHLQRLLESAGQSFEAARPVLEVNPGHPIVQRIAASEDEDRTASWASIVFDQALLAEGGRLDDPAGFVRRLNEVLLGLGEGGGTQPRPGHEDADAGSPPAAAPETAGEEAGEEKEA